MPEVVFLARLHEEDGRSLTCLSWKLGYGPSVTEFLPEFLNYPTRIDRSCEARIICALLASAWFDSEREARQSTSHMAAENHRTIIVVAIIGLLGTLGGAVITNWDKMFPDRTPSAADNLVAPHAPPIEINQSFKLWGEDTIQMDLQPGGTKTLKAMELYANWATYPSSSCAGPGLVPYTWQVRVPYPRRFDGGKH
jgi:hypothetical protein